MWRLNASLLNDPIFREVEKALRQYFNENSLSDTLPHINWATHKATIHGKLQIAPSAKQVCEHTTKQQDEEPQRLKGEQRSNPHLDLRYKLDMA